MSRLSCAPLRRRCLSLALLAALSACAGLPPGKPTASILDTHVPAGYNGVVLVRASRADAPVVKTWGQAQFETPAAFAADTPFMVGSVSKWITAVTVLRLAEQGKLDLDQPITTWLPELPAASRAVTLRHLLSNTSGIERGLTLALKRDPGLERLMIPAREAALRFGSGPLLFAPGTRFDYSSTNWVIVAGIVERVTGEPFTRAVVRLVLEPAGVRQTGFASLDPAGTPRLALAYGSERTARKMPAAPPMAAAAGTVYSSAQDLVKIADLVYSERLLSAASRRELMSVQHAPEEYALGGRVKQVGNATLAWESGVMGGYKSLLAYAPEDGRAVVLLNNTDMAQSEQARIALALLDALAQ
ncbi:serine hydrolase [Massilia sp. Mn16-1_5]|uniref:serine hydrolase domain-containing protein n=1 Tax=Massilia sp. Mn16-1_5 TaxID=2079199 RepID=UPI001446E7A8|nr:serine hydrolase domain-containing protein [Massilia sp. Mn16-1_5]